MSDGIDSKTYVLGVYEAEVKIHRPKEDWTVYCVERVAAKSPERVLAFLEKKYADNHNRTCEISSVLEKGEIAVTNPDILNFFRQNHERTVGEKKYMPLEILVE